MECLLILPTGRERATDLKIFSLPYATQAIHGRQSSTTAVLVDNPRANKTILGLGGEDKELLFGLLGNNSFADPPHPVFTTKKGGCLMPKLVYESKTSCNHNVRTI